MEAEAQRLPLGPSSLGPPSLDLATGPRALPTQGCATCSLHGLFPGHMANGFRAEDTREASLSSLDPSQAKGPQGVSKASPQPPGPGAGMTHAGTPQHHLGPMSPQMGKQDGKDGVVGTRSISVNTQTLCFCFYREEGE